MTEQAHTAKTTDTSVVLRPVDIDDVRTEILDRGYSIRHNVVDPAIIDAVRDHWLAVYADRSQLRPLIWGPYFGEPNRVVYDQGASHTMYRSYDFLWNAPQHGLTRELGLALSRMRNRIAEHDERAGEYMDSERYGIYLTTSYYPPGDGWLEVHRDEMHEGWRHWHYILPMTFRGTDFSAGGLFVEDRDGNRVDVDAEMSPGSVVFFDGTCRHGVDKIEVSGAQSLGRLQMFAIPVWFELPSEQDRVLEEISSKQFIKSRLRMVRDKLIGPPKSHYRGE